MKRRYQIACLVAGGMALWCGTLRSFGNSYGTAAAVLIVASTAAVFLLCGSEPRTERAVSGKTVFPTAVMTALVGITLLFDAVGNLFNRLRGGYPYPKPITATTVNEALLFLMIGGGVLGGLVLVFTALHWLSNRKLERGLFGAAALVPLLWIWGRLVWYMLSFTSAANRFRSMTEVALLLFEMLFLLRFARFVSGVEEKAPRFDTPIALCTAMLGISVFITRAVAYVSQNQSLFSATALFSSADFAITALAAAWVLGQVFGGGEEAPPLPMEEEPEEVTLSEDEQGFLLDEEVLNTDSGITEEEEETEVEHRPMELEDIIEELMKQNG